MQESLVLKQKNEDTKQTTAQADGQKAEADKEQEAGARSDLQTEYDTILEKCQKEFISNRPIDENFLAWFHSKYGDETLKKVADEVEKENQDPEYMVYIDRQYDAGALGLLLPGYRISV